MLLLLYPQTQVLGGTIDCTASSSQAQGATASTELGIGSTAANSQAQSASGTFAIGIDATEAASQGQSASGTFARAVDSITASSQAQSALGTFSTSSSVDCTIATSQAQSATGSLDCHAVTEWWPLVGGAIDRKRCEDEAPEVLPIIEAIAKELPKAPVTQLRAELKKYDIAYEESYKKMLQTIIKAKKAADEQDDEETLLMLL